MDNGGDGMTPDEELAIQRWLERRAFTASFFLLALLIVCVWRFW
jgi:hypothetical protein